MEVATLRAPWKTATKNMKTIDNNHKWQGILTTIHTFQYKGMRKQRTKLTGNEKHLQDPHGNWKPTQQNQWGRTNLVAKTELQDRNIN